MQLCIRVEVAAVFPFTPCFQISLLGEPGGRFLLCYHLQEDVG